MFTFSVFEAVESIGDGWFTVERVASIPLSDDDGPRRWIQAVDTTRAEKGENGWKATLTTSYTYMEDMDEIMSLYVTDYGVTLLTQDEQVAWQWAWGNADSFVTRLKAPPDTWLARIAWTMNKEECPR
jgi:hypothetical protein